MVWRTEYLSYGRGSSPHPGRAACRAEIQFCGRTSAFRHSVPQHPSAHWIRRDALIGHSAAWSDEPRPMSRVLGDASRVGHHVPSNGPLELEDGVNAHR